MESASCLIEGFNQLGIGGVVMQWARGIDPKLLGTFYARQNIQTPEFLEKVKAEELIRHER